MIAFVLKFHHTFFLCVVQTRYSMHCILIHDPEIPTVNAVYYNYPTIVIAVCYRLWVKIVSVGLVS